MTSVRPSTTCCSGVHTCWCRVTTSVRHVPFPVRRTGAGLRKVPGCLHTITTIRRRIRRTAGNRCAPVRLLQSRVNLPHTACFFSHKQGNLMHKCIRNVELLKFHKRTIFFDILLFYKIKMTIYLPSPNGTFLF